MRPSSRWLLSAASPRLRRLAVSLFLRGALLLLATRIRSPLDDVWTVIVLIVEVLMFGFFASSDPGWLTEGARPPHAVSLTPLSNRESDLRPGASVNDRRRPAPRNLRSYCSICCVLPPLRAQHCPVCDCCVAQFDHHYFFFGCVGEKNRLRFLLWLTAATSASAMVLRSLEEAHNYTLNGENSLWTFLCNNGVFITICSMWWALFAYLGFILLMQLVLLSINATLFEATKHRWQIAYFRGYNTCDIPFKPDPFELLRGDALLLWRSSNKWAPARPLPPGDPELRRDSADLCLCWENKYWSMC